jgi:RHS repeat-associated protein
VVEHLEYLPGGELLFDLRTTDWFSKYRFTAKEQDSETGLYYVSQRYSNPQTNLWLSVDQLRAKYPFASAYNHCLGNPVKYVDTNGKWPTKKIVDNGRIGSHFGWRVHPITGKRTHHNGQDFPAASGSDIHAAASGVVINTGYQYNPKKKTGWGYYVDIKHKDGTVTKYSHLQAGSINVHNGDKVADGQVIGASGASGASGGVTGPHLDLEIIRNGKPVDPLSISDLQKNISVNTTQNQANTTVPSSVTINVVLPEVVVVGQKPVKNEILPRIKVDDIQTNIKPLKL